MVTALMSLRARGRELQAIGRQGADHPVRLNNREGAI